MSKPQKRQKFQQGNCCYKAFITTVKEHLLSPASLVNNKSTIPKWRDITQIQKFAYYMMFMKTDDMMAITIDFSHAFRSKFSQQTYKKLKDTIRRRLNENLKNNLEYVPDYAFVIEKKNTQLHIHGVIRLSESQLSLAGKAFKTTAFGAQYEQFAIKNHILNIKKLYNPNGWLRYMLKSCWTAGKSIYISQNLRRLIREDYLSLEQIKTKD